MLITVKKLNDFLDRFDVKKAGMVKDEKIDEVKKIIRKYKLPERYLEGLVGDERLLRQMELISKKRKSPKERYEPLETDIIAREKKIPKSGSCTMKWNKMYPNKSTNSEKAKITGIPKDILDKVDNKGKGAYYSSGSRPGQTSQSWGKARVNCFILNKPSVTRGPDRKLYEDAIKRSPKAKKWFENNKWN
jgi:hypothetical protein